MHLHLCSCSYAVRLFAQYCIGGRYAMLCYAYMGTIPFILRICWVM